MCVSECVSVLQGLGWGQGVMERPRVTYSQTRAANSETERDRDY